MGWRRKSAIRLFVLGGVFAAGSWVYGVESRQEQRQATIDLIDRMVLQRIEAAGVTPAAESTDSEFLRRCSLDLAGAIPSVSEVRAFLADPAPDKRAALIERLLRNPATINHLAEVWRNAMLPKEGTIEQIGNSAGLHRWLREQFAKNLRYDRVVSDLVAATGSADDGPALYFTSLELQPKKLAASTARMFLGLHLECAECHKHPFDDWTQHDFWGYAAFFAQLPQPSMEGPVNNIRLVDRTEGEVTLPESEETVPPKFPGGGLVGRTGLGSRRQQLSIWMASPDNPYLARAAVNRVWALVFGRGLVQPVDDLGPHNPASHPEVLEALTEYFVASGYDLQELFRLLCNTKTYGRSSRVEAANPPAPELFAAMGVKVFTAEQLYDSVSCCLTQSSRKNNDSVSFDINDRRRLFINQMAGKGNDAAEYERGLQQSLHLMNGSETSEATDVERSALLMSLEAPFLTPTQRIEILYLATLSRFPASHEITRITEFLPQDESTLPAAYADILWALLNSAEFTLNH